jgi:hypothetical protein
MRASEKFNETVKEAVKIQLGKKLVEKMKFYPGLSTVEEFLSWNASIAGPRMGQVKELPKLTSGPRILSMHDMAGGYNEMPDNDYLMMFRSWNLVDIFVYFTHVVFAVPPLQWTATAHSHGRLAMGTLIFEGNPEADKISQMIRDSKKRATILSQLVNIADHYGFDGWFVNVEGGNWASGDPAKFVAELRDAMHEKLGARSQVIAYPYGPDSEMFKAADGVFAQYNWGASDESVKRVAAAAGNRKSDVYMGTDAFGGERGNDEPDPEHVGQCAKFGLSLAVFAPGYTLEVGSQKKYSAAAVDYDHRYWNSIGKSFGRQVNTSEEWPVKFEKSSSGTAVQKKDGVADRETTQNLHGQIKAHELKQQLAVTKEELDVVKNSARTEKANAESREDKLTRELRQLRTDTKTEVHEHKKAMAEFQAAKEAQDVAKAQENTYHLRQAILFAVIATSVVTLACAHAFQRFSFRDPKELKKSSTWVPVPA